MALYKPIRQPDGVVTNYHRILYVDLMINSHVSIAVLSYVDAESRSMEAADNTPYMVAKTYEREYQENMTVEEAYAFLKTLEDFEEAEDV